MNLRNEALFLGASASVVSAMLAAERLARALSDTAGKTKIRVSSVVFFFSGVPPFFFSEVYKQLTTRGRGGRGIRNCVSLPLRLKRMTTYALRFHSLLESALRICSSRSASLSPCTRSIPQSARARQRVCASAPPASNFAAIREDSDEGIGGVSDGRFGPEALLLCGFSLAESRAIRACLDELGASFVLSLVLSTQLLDGTLGEALGAADQGDAPPQPALGTPRMAFISGLSGAEAMELIAAIQELELPPCIFAAAVPNSMNKPLRYLLEEIVGDHERLAASH